MSNQTTIAPPDDPTGTPPLTYATYLDGTPAGPDGGLIVCSDCGEPMPVCPDLCGTLGGSIPSAPPAPRRRPFRIGTDGRVAA